MKKSVLVVSSDHTFASLLERDLGLGFEVHSASTDLAAFALLDSYAYACMVADLSTASVAGGEALWDLRLKALTMPIVAVVPPGNNMPLPSNTIVVKSGPDVIAEVAAAIREAV